MANGESTKQKISTTAKHCRLTPHAGDRRNRGDFVDQDARAGIPDLSAWFSRWQLTGNVRRYLLLAGSAQLIPMNTPPSNIIPKELNV